MCSLPFNHRAGHCPHSRLSTDQVSLTPEECKQGGCVVVTAAMQACFLTSWLQWPGDSAQVQVHTHPCSLWNLNSYQLGYCFISKHDCRDKNNEMNFTHRLLKVTEITLQRYNERHLAISIIPSIQVHGAPVVTMTSKSNPHHSEPTSSFHQLWQNEAFASK